MFHHVALFRLKPDITLERVRQAREEFEKVYLEYQLKQHEGNISRMAKEVGMERTHLYRKLKSLEIEFKDKR